MERYLRCGVHVLAGIEHREGGRKGRGTKGLSFFFFPFFFSFFFSLFRLPLSLFVLGRAVPSGPEHSRSNAFSLLK